MLKTGAVGWDLRLFRILNQVPAAPASILTPLSHLFLPAGIIVVIVLTVAYDRYAVLVSWSRVYLGVHYPLDVLAGARIGMAVGGVILLALGTLLRRQGRAANGRDAATDVRAPGAGPQPRRGPLEQRKRSDPEL